MAGAEMTKETCACLNEAPEPGGERLSAGTLIGDYVILQYIASGGFGLVYEARHTSTGRRVAIKVMRSTLVTREAAIGRFMREANVLKSISHPNVVEILDCGVLQDGRLFHVMEFLEGQTLSEMLMDNQRFSVREALEYFEPTCAALIAAHRANFVHRDVKASNIVTTMVDGERVVKLVDFGLVKLLNMEPGRAVLTQACHRVGTLHAMAPEQFFGGDISPATDIYALGVLLFRLLTGRYPFHSNNPVELERMHLLVRPPHLSDFVPTLTPLDGIVAHCLEKSPSARFTSVDALLAALRAVVGERKDTPTKLAQGYAIHMHLTPRSCEQTVFGDVRDQIADAIEESEYALIRAGFKIVLATEDTVLGIRLSPDNAQSLDHSWTETINLARARHEQMQWQFDDSVDCTVVVHCADVRVRDAESGPMIAGGPLTRLGSWLPMDAAAGIHMVGHPRMNIMEH